MSMYPIAKSTTLACDHSVLSNTPSKTKLPEVLGSFLDLLRREKSHDYEHKLQKPSLYHH